MGRRFDGGGVLGLELLEGRGLRGEDVGVGDGVGLVLEDLLEVRGRALADEDVEVVLELGLGGEVEQAPTATDGSFLSIVPLFDGVFRAGPRMRTSVQPLCSLSGLLLLLSCFMSWQKISTRRSGAARPAATTSTQRSVDAYERFSPMKPMMLRLTLRASLRSLGSSVVNDVRSLWAL